MGVYPHGSLTGCRPMTTVSLAYMSTIVWTTSSVCAIWTTRHGTTRHGMTRVQKTLEIEEGEQEKGTCGVLHVRLDGLPPFAILPGVDWLRRDCPCSDAKKTNKQTKRLPPLSGHNPWHEAREHGSPGMPHYLS